MRQLVEQKEAKHAAFAVGAKGHAGRVGGCAQALHQAARARPQGLEKAGALELFERSQAAGGGHGVAAQGAGLIDRAQRGQLLHHGAFAAESGQRHAATDHLAQHREVGLEAGDVLRIQALRAAERNAKAAHHLIEGQQRAVLAAQLATAAHEGHAGAHEVHVASNGLDHQAGDGGAVFGKSGFELGHIVVFEHQRVLHHLGRHPGAGGVAKGG